MIPDIPIEKSTSLQNLNHLTLISNNSAEKYPSSTIIDKTARIILIGDSGVGKSCIIMQYVQGMFKEKVPCTAGKIPLSLPHKYSIFNYNQGWNFL
jgi:GTPase SAR1 family protein